MPESIPKPEFERIIRQFFKDVNYIFPPLVYNDNVMTPVVDRARRVAVAQGLDPDWMADIARQSVDTTLLIYAKHEPKLQELLALFTTYFFTVDDKTGSFIEAAHTFRENLVHATPQDNPFLNDYVQLLEDIAPYYGSHGATSIFTGTMDFVAATAVEYQTNRSLDKHINPAAGKFPTYFRLKTGVTAAYASMIWPGTVFSESEKLPIWIQAIPDLLEYSSYVNDVMSFYKESIVSDECDTYVYFYAATHGLSVRESFETLVADTVRCVQNVRAILKDEPGLLAYAEDYIQGCVALHVYIARYRMDELDLKPE